ncbi:hypothetical protein CAPI_04445 [Corynebacterium capitovis DSM 44611]|uniref:DNA-processing protein DprA n=1 Tax=Corynebacterium capitovis TaxID=131081 RepID=UPI000362E37B|nr:DNA-processing protein DprA [Corynebacterium capitovis]WKD57447.1 hypothetical protein CAPI_04445 [Corynebacterium capitovis DSM 44611]
MSTVESWAYLSRVIEGPSYHLQQLLRAGRDADEIAEGVRKRSSWLGGLARETESRFAWERTEQDLLDATAAGFQLLTPDMAGWPSTEMERSFGTGVSMSLAGGDTFRDGGVAPHALWVAGSTNLAGLFAQSVSIVGTRASSTYGNNATADLVAGLASRRYTIVSGGAVGIDAVAHETALTHGATTVVVAACGPGVTYPRRHEELFARIVEAGGAVVTEYPPGVSPDRHRFLTRNRLVAALTQGCVVVEAAFRSGALNTLSWGNYFNRHVMAVPGPIFGAGSLGTNLAIRDGRAAMVLNATDVHDTLSALGEGNGLDADGQRELDFAATSVQRLSRNELRVYDALPANPSAGLAAADIAAASGLSMGLSVHILVELASRGVVRRAGTKWHRVEED